MKEILFKAKRIDNGEWVEGSVITRKYFNTDEVFETFIVTDAYEQLGVRGYGTTSTLISFLKKCSKLFPKISIILITCTTLKILFCYSNLT